MFAAEFPLDAAVVAAEAAEAAAREAEGQLYARHSRELGDALEEASCTDAELLAHLGSPGPHVRGCFALDAVLGKN